GQYNHGVRDGPVVLDFGNSEVRFDSCELLSGVGHSEGYVGRDSGNSHVRSAACELSNAVGFSESYFGRGSMVLDFENCGVCSVGDEIDSAGVEAFDYRARAGCKVVGSYFIGNYYDDYFRQPGSVWSPGESSLGVVSGTQRVNLLRSRLKQMVNTQMYCMEYHPLRRISVGYRQF
nr:hypothetical protein [Tanacetum cinerariifolium]